MMAHAWLAFWLMFTGVTVGATAWKAIHSLTGGAWGDTLAPALLGLRRLFPVAAMVGLPLLLGAAHVFPWIDAPVDAARRWYLNYPFLAYRSIACFLAWGVAWRLCRRAPAVSLIIWLFTCGVFGNDWIVSLAPEWRSADIGLVVALSQLVVSFAVALLASGRVLIEIDHATRRDLGGLLLALCLGWAYLAGIDYLTAWIADQPFETAWYLPRTLGIWAVLAIAALAFHLLLPFALLLVRSAKEKAHVLRTASVSALLGQACYVCWMVLP